MIVHKLISSQKKQLTQKQPYKKPVYKSYKELLQLDRPKKNISYESSSSEQDFLQKLLKEEKKKTKSQKKNSRKNTSRNGSRNEKRSRGQKRHVAVNSKKEEEEQEKKKAKPKVLNEIELFLAQTKDLEPSGEKNPEKEQLPSQVTKEPRTVKSNSMTRIKVTSYNQRSKQKKQDILMSNPIFIDTKSIETPPIFYTSASKMLTKTLPTKQRNAYQQLLSQKHKYQEQFQKCSLQTDLQQESVRHKVNSQLSNNFPFNPTIEPLYHNWRMHLTFNPLENQPIRQFKDRKNLFKNELQEERFLNSLRQLAKLKR